jgi:hypothetical protein
MDDQTESIINFFLDEMRNSARSYEKHRSENPEKHGLVSGGGEILHVNNLDDCKKIIKQILKIYNCSLDNDHGVMILIDKDTTDIIELDMEDLNVY